MRTPAIVRRALQLSRAEYRLRAAARAMHKAARDAEAAVSLDLNNLAALQTIQALEQAGKELEAAALLYGSLAPARKRRKRTRKR